MIVQSSVGQGTTFSVFLPASSRIVRAPAAVGAPKAWRGDGLVLVVDDEESVRKVAARMLDRMGFRVDQANDGQVAIEMFEKRRTTTPPCSSTSRCLAWEGRKPWPPCETSGRVCPSCCRAVTTNLKRWKAMQSVHGVQFIQKPYKFDELAGRIRAVLSRPEEGVA